jgi:hypothetical protein
MKKLIAILLIITLTNCTITETVTTPTIQRKAIIEGNEVTVVTTHKISLSQYNEIKKGYDLIVVK